MKILSLGNIVGFLTTNILLGLFWLIPTFKYKGGTEEYSNFGLMVRELRRHDDNAGTLDQWLPLVFITLAVAVLIGIIAKKVCLKISKN